MAQLVPFLLFVGPYCSMRVPQLAITHHTIYPSSSLTFLTADKRHFYALPSLLRSLFSATYLWACLPARWESDLGRLERARGALAPLLV